MKNVVAVVLLCGFSLPLFAQEYDDMYFRAKDRQKAYAVKATVSNYQSFKNEHFPEAGEEIVNPTDSYSARQLNPEFLSLSHTSGLESENTGYFDSQYRPTTAALSYNNTYFYNNPWNNWNTGWYGFGWARPWNNPWYWGYYDPWLNPWMSPWGPSFGWNPGWNYGFNSFWAPGYSGWTISVGYSWGSSWGYNAWCPTYWNSWGLWNRPVYIINGRNEINRNYGKRYSQTTPVAGDVRNHYATPRRSLPGSQVNNGSTAGRTTRDEAYYVPPSRRSAPVRQNSSVNSQERSSSGFNSRSGSSFGSDSYDRSSGGMLNSRPSYTPSRSSGSFSRPGSGSRPSAPSGGRSRGGQ